MTGNQKISGILIENSVKGKFINHSVIGVGINVNQKKFKDLPNATSLFIETGLEFSLDSLACRLAEIFSKNFYLFDKTLSNVSTKKRAFELLKTIGGLTFITLWSGPSELKRIFLFRISFTILCVTCLLGSRVSRSLMISIPRNNPLPLTSPMMS